MANNVDKFLDEGEHFNIDHTGITGVGGSGTTFVGAEVLFADNSPSAAGTLFTVPADTLTVDNQSLEIVMGFGSGDGASPTWTVQLGGQNLFVWSTIPTPGSDGVGQVTMTIFRTGATTGRVVMRGTMGQDGSAAGTVSHALHEVVGTLSPVDWTASLALTTAFAGGMNESIHNARIVKWPEIGSAGLPGIGSDTLPVGVIVPFGGAIAAVPTGFLPCDGSTVSLTTYADLFTAIGTAWNTGGEPGGTFRLPDLRAKSPVGINDGSLPAGTDGAFSVRALAATGGEESHTLTVGEMPSHQHTRDYGEGSGGISSFDFTTNNYGSTTNPLGGATGSDGAHNTMHPFAVCAYIIKAQQVGGGLGTSAQDNGGAVQGPQPTLNFIPSGGAGVTVVENVPQNRIDITISAPSGGVTAVTKAGFNFSVTQNNNFQHNGLGTAVYAIVIGKLDASDELSFGMARSPTGNNSFVNLDVNGVGVAMGGGSGGICLSSGGATMSSTFSGGDITITANGFGAGTIRCLSWGVGYS